MKILFAAAIALATLSGAATAKERQPAPPYVVIDENARLPLAQHSVLGFHTGADSSVIIEATGRRWYRATLSEPCRTDLPFRDVIGLETHGVDTLDRFAMVRVRGQSCFIRSLEQIENPYRRAPSAEPAQGS